MHDYHGRIGVRVHFIDNPELQFVSHDNYDYYLSTCLEYEAENMVLEAIDNTVQVSRVACEMSISCSDKDLFEYYEQNGCSLSWTDEECYGTLDSVRVYYTPIEELDASQAKIIAESIVDLFYDKEAMNYCMVRLIADSKSYSPYNFYFLIKNNVVYEDS